MWSPSVSVSLAVTYSPNGSIMSRSVLWCLGISNVVSYCPTVSLFLCSLMLCQDGVSWYDVSLWDIMRHNETAWHTTRHYGCNGTVWDSMRNCDNRPHETLWDIMRQYETLWDNETSWDIMRHYETMTHHEILWDSMRHRDSRRHHEILWDSMTHYEIIGDIMRYYKAAWDTTRHYRSNGTVWDSTRQ